MDDSNSEPPSTVGGLLAASVARRGDHPAIVMRAETLSYADFDQRTSKFARALLASGAGKGTRMAILASDGIYWLTAYFAAMRIGAVVATVSTLATPTELAHILRNSDCQILIATRRFLRHEYAERLEATLPGLTRQKAGKLRLTSAPYLRSIWLDDAEGVSWAQPTSELIARADEPDAPDEQLLAAIEAEVHPSDPCMIVYTSGSTALPKAVMHRHWSIARQGHELARQFCIKESDRMMPLLPTFWVGGISMALEVLSTGGTLVYPDTPATDVVLQMIRDFNVNRLNTWGPQQAKLREAVAAAGIDPETIGGLAQPRDKHGVPIPQRLQANMLGMTESFCPHSSEPLDTRLPDDKAGSSGRAMNGIERRVVDPETGEPVPFGTVGELQLRGGALMMGFYKVDPAQVFTKDGWYPTNDLVRMEEDGHLYFHARRGDMLKVSGANVSRLEVQAALAAIPEVDLPIVVGLSDGGFGQIVIAGVVPKEGQAPAEDYLKEELRKTLSSFKVPRHIVLLRADEVQWTPSNKVKLTEMTEVIAGKIEKVDAAA